MSVEFNKLAAEIEELLSRKKKTVDQETLDIGVDISSLPDNQKENAKQLLENIQSILNPTRLK